MAKCLNRACPKCNGDLGIVVPERKVKKPVQAINGLCLKCGYRLAWILIVDRRSSSRKPVMKQLDSSRGRARLTVRIVGLQRIEMERFAGTLPETPLYVKMKFIRAFSIEEMRKMV
jgi:hypothetical protein